MEYFRVKTRDGSRNVAQKPILIATQSCNHAANWEDDIAASRLYRTGNGQYFEVINDPNTDTDIVIQLSVQDAIQFFEDPTAEPEMDFQQAFPSEDELKEMDL